MAHKQFEDTDPLEPVAVSLSTPGYDGLEVMARCFVEDYALMGWPASRIFRLFTIPEFAGSYAVYHERGEDYVRRLIADVLGGDLDGIDAAPLSVAPVDAPFCGPERKGDADA